MAVSPESPVVFGHPYLREDGFVAIERLDAFGVLAAQEADSALQATSYRDPPRMDVGAVVAALDPRLERVNRQQYLKLAVVRRDLTFVMCGTSGRLVLSGTRLTPSTTSSATRPIRRRLLLAGIALASVAAGCATFSRHFGGSGDYFKPVNGWLLVASSVLVVLAAAPTFAVLRALGPRWSFGRVTRLEQALGVAACAAALALLVVGLTSQPKLSAVESALAAGATTRARVILEGIKEKEQSSEALLVAEDSVLVAEATSARLEQRLGILDRVGRRGGPRAGEAASQARQARLGELRRLNEAKSHAEALGFVQRWFDDRWRDDVDVAEERARAFEHRAGSCPDPLCRWTAYDNALTSRADERRGKLRAESRTALVEALKIDGPSNEPALARLKRLREVGALASKTAAARADADVLERAKTVADRAASERAKVVLLGAEPGTVSELLGEKSETDGKNTYLDLGPARLYLALDAQKRCRGFYLVGPTKAQRSLSAGSPGASAILSQIVGHRAEVKRPAAGAAGTARWYEHPASVVARWNGDALVELRVGDATP